MGRLNGCSRPCRERLLKQQVLNPLAKALVQRNVTLLSLPGRSEVGCPMLLELNEDVSPEKSRGMIDGF
jgi:hypothetical protein